MNILRQFLFRLQPFYRRRKIEADLDEEIRIHLDMATQANIAKGMGEDEGAWRPAGSSGGSTR